MLRWALIFLVVAILAGIIAYTGPTPEAAQVAKVLALIGLILAVGALLFHRRSRGGRSPS